MRATKSAAASVLERFPDHWHVIVELYQSNEDFRELCDHYAECQGVLGRLAGTPHADRARHREYSRLTDELAAEIRILAEQEQARATSNHQGETDG